MTQNSLVRVERKQEFQTARLWQASLPPPTAMGTVKLLIANRVCIGQGVGPPPQRKPRRALRALRDVGARMMTGWCGMGRLAFDVLARHNRAFVVLFQKLAHCQLLVSRLGNSRQAETRHFAYILKTNIVITLDGDE